MKFESHFTVLSPMFETSCTVTRVKPLQQAHALGIETERKGVAEQSPYEQKDVPHCLLELMMSVYIERKATMIFSSLCLS